MFLYLFFTLDFILLAILHASIFYDRSSNWCRRNLLLYPHWSWHLYSLLLSDQFGCCGRFQCPCCYPSRRFVFFISKRKKKLFSFPLSPPPQKVSLLPFPISSLVSSSHSTKFRTTGSGPIIFHLSVTHWRVLQLVNSQIKRSTVGKMGQKGLFLSLWGMTCSITVKLPMEIKLLRVTIWRVVINGPGWV